MKTIDEIYREMLACFGEETGLEPREGTDLSARMYALAAQVYALYVQADWTARQCFPQTAHALSVLSHGGEKGRVAVHALLAAAIFQELGLHALQADFIHLV